MLTLTPESINGRLTVFALLLGVLVLVVSISIVLVLMARARYRMSQFRQWKPRVVRPDPWSEAGNRLSVDLGPAGPGTGQDIGPEDDDPDDSDDDGDIPRGDSPKPHVPTQAL